MVKFSGFFILANFIIRCPVIPSCIPPQPVYLLPLDPLLHTNSEAIFETANTLIRVRPTIPLTMGTNIHNIGQLFVHIFLMR